MVGENLDAATAGYRVGYDDPSQFSREHMRLFGQPPMRDVERLPGVARDGLPVYELWALDLGETTFQPGGPDPRPHVRSRYLGRHRNFQRP